MFEEKNHINIRINDIIILQNDFAKNKKYKR